MRHLETAREEEFEGKLDMHYNSKFSNDFFTPFSTDGGTAGEAEILIVLIFTVGLLRSLL